MAKFGELHLTVGYTFWGTLVYSEVCGIFNPTTEGYSLLMKLSFHLHGKAGHVVPIHCEQQIDVACVYHLHLSGESDQLAMIY